MKFEELACGDRFKFLGLMWTKLSPDTARKHSLESIELVEKSYGYNGDPICYIGRALKVKFIPINEDQ